jgi:predicted GNAT family acetyltransferase
MQSVSVVYLEDFKEYFDKVFSLLRHEERHNSWILGILERDQAKVDRMALVERDGIVVAAFFFSGYSWIFPRECKPFVKEICDFLSEKQENLTKLNGEISLLQEIAKEWITLNPNQTPKYSMNAHLYAVDQQQFIVPGNIPEGSARSMKEEDLHIIADWRMKFVQEVTPNEINYENALSMAKDLLKNGFTFIWEKDGIPVATTTLARPSLNGFSINFVYTDLNFRKQGFARAIVAHATRKSFEFGKEFCTLFADIDNSVTNRMYQKLGYQYLYSTTILEFK